jgi:TolB-like protein
MNVHSKVGLIGVTVGLLLGALTADSVWAVELREGVEQLATQLVKGVREGKQLRVAVSDFPDLQGITSNLGRYIAERLTTLLAQNPKLSVIERRRFGQVLGELKFSMSDLVDPNKAKQLSRMLGVEAIVVGTVSDLGNHVDLDARMIEIEANRMLLGATTTISKDQVVKEMMEQGRETAAPASTPGLQPGAQPKQPTKARDSKSTDLAEAIKESAVALAKRAERAVGGSVVAKGLVTEYNRLLQEAKSVLKDEPSIQTLKELEYSGDSFHTTRMVATASRKLELVIEATQ